MDAQLWVRGTGVAMDGPPASTLNFGTCICY
jgi:hypothetical protein